MGKVVDKVLIANFAQTIRVRYPKDLNQSYLKDFVDCEDLIKRNIDRDFPWHVDVIDRINGIVRPELDQMIVKMEKVYHEMNGGFNTDTDEGLDAKDVLEFLQSLQTGRQTGFLIDQIRRRQQDMTDPRPPQK